MLPALSIAIRQPVVTTRQTDPRTRGKTAAAGATRCVQKTRTQIGDSAGGRWSRSHVSRLRTATARFSRCDQPCGLRSHSRTCGSAPDLEILTPRGSGAACPETTSEPARPPAGQALLHEGRDPLAKGYPYCTSPRPPCSTPNPPPVAPQPRAVHRHQPHAPPQDSTDPRARYTYTASAHSRSVAYSAPPTSCAVAQPTPDRPPSTGSLLRGLLSRRRASRRRARDLRCPRAHQATEGG